MGYLAPGNVQFNYAQLEGIWCQAGGNPGSAPLAAAIAMAESGGNSTATGTNPGSVDRGLWQVNSVHGTQSTYDVMGNARAAVSISSNGTDWSPWTTYTNGAYKQYLQTNVPADTSSPVNATNAQVNQNTATLTGTGPLPGGLKDPLNWFLNPLGTAQGVVGGAQSQASKATAGVFGAVGSTLVKYFIQSMLVMIINPGLQLAAGVGGILAGATLMTIGVWTAAKHTETGAAAERGIGTAAQAGMLAFGPEAAATTQYVGQAGTTTVRQTRRAAGRFTIGGRPVQYRPTRVTTTVQRPEEAAPAGTGESLRNEARGYTRRNYGDTYSGPRTRQSRRTSYEYAPGQTYEPPQRRRRSS